MNLSIVIPVYRSEGTLQDLHSRLKASLEPMGHTFEVIFVEDGGGDGSWAKIEGLAKEDSRVRGIRFSRNFGQHNAILCGIRAAEKDVVVTMDDDLQHPPEEITKLLRKLEEGEDVVYGIYERPSQGLFRRLTTYITKLIMNFAMGNKFATRASAFRAFRTPLREAFRDYRGTFVSIDVLLSWATQRFSTVAVRHDSRCQGKSHYTFSKLATHALNLMTGFSTLPLQLASYLGFILTLFGVGILVYVVINYFLRGNPVPGFPFLASIIAIFSGAQLFVLGIIGEYLARMHSQMMNRPSYVIQTSTSNDSRESVGRTLRIS